MLDRETGFWNFGHMSIMRLKYWPIWAVMCLPLDPYAAAAARYIPDCAGRVEIANASVKRVEKNGALILSDGRSVLLEGIRLPPGDQIALRQLIQQQRMTFTVTPPKQDRYERLRAQAFGKDWIQMALLEQGLARVSIAPDRDECAPDFYEAEARARAKRAGIWALPAYRIRTPQEMKGVAGTFQLMEGQVRHVGSGAGRIFIDFGDGDRPSLSVLIAPEDRRAFRDFDLYGLQGRSIRIRGLVQDYRGRPEIALSNPAQIELLP
jgi:hypothetical protein